MACALMVLDHSYAQFARVRAALSLAVYPIHKLVDAPITIAQNIGRFAASHQSLYIENQKLKEEQLVLQGRLQRMAALETENLHLRQLEESGANVAENMLMANIINIDPDPFTHQVIIDKGLKDGVSAGQTLIDADGIMGTVITVNETDSRAILITDASHAVPVEDVRNGLRAIAVGTGSGILELRHVPNTTDIAEGDIMITSGLGGRYPVGFPVGKVQKVVHEPGKPFATITLAPTAKLDRGRHVLLIKKTANHSAIVGQYEKK